MFRFQHGYFADLPRVETERLILRRMMSRDAEDIFAYSKDEAVARHVLWEAQRSVTDAKEYLRYMNRQYRTNQPSSWGIEDKTSGKLIGTIGFMNCSFDHNSAEIGYSLSKEHWNKGLMTEAVEVCLDYAFGEMHLNRVEAQHEVSNPSSGRVMEKCGMKKEGVMRERLYNKGRYVDVCVYAIVRSDWRALRGIADKREY